MLGIFELLLTLTQDYGSKHNNNLDGIICNFLLLQTEGRRVVAWGICLFSFLVQTFKNYITAELALI